MKYGKIENYKIVGTCITQSENYPDEIPDDAELFDYYVNGTLYLEKDFFGKTPTIVDNNLVWIDDLNFIHRNIKAQIATIDSKITEIENKTYRQIREITLGLDTDGTAQAKLTASNTQITALRTERATLAAQII